MKDINEKIEILNKNFPEEFLEISNMLDTIYQQVIKKKKHQKTPSFKAFGKMYENTTFTKNYIRFCDDVSKIQDAAFFERLLGSKKATTNLDNFSFSIINDEAYVKLSNGIFLSKDMNTNNLIRVISNIAKELDINIEFYNIEK
jgi:hypothetical protein